MSKTDEEKALELAGLKCVPDDEDRYYNRRACEIFDKCMEMAKWKEEHVIDNAARWIGERVGVDCNVECDEFGVPYAESFIDHAEKRLAAAREIMDGFKRDMSGEKSENQ